MSTVGTTSSISLYKPRSAVTKPQQNMTTEIHRSAQLSSGLSHVVEMLQAALRTPVMPRAPVTTPRPVLACAIRSSVPRSRRKRLPMVNEKSERPCASAHRMIVAKGLEHGIIEKSPHPTMGGRTRSLTESS